MFHSVELNQFAEGDKNIYMSNDFPCKGEFLFYVIYMNYQTWDCLLIISLQYKFGLGFGNFIDQTNKR